MMDQQCQNMDLSTITTWPEGINNEYIHLPPVGERRYGQKGGQPGKERGPSPLAEVGGQLWCCCPEILRDGQRLTRAQVERMGGKKKKMPKMVLW